MKSYKDEFCSPPPQNSPSIKNQDCSSLQGKSRDFDAPFTHQELENALRASKPDTSPGLDQVTDKMLLNLPNNLKKLLLITFNEIFCSNNFPREWKEFLMILIPEDKTNKKFRPITLASCLLKLMERMIQSRLLHYLEKNQILPDTQSGFRKSKSCACGVCM